MNERFLCCPHGSINTHCQQCSITYLLLVFKYSDLPKLPKDIKKLLSTYLKYPDIYCSRCVKNHCIPDKNGHLIAGCIKQGSGFDDSIIGYITLGDDFHINSDGNVYLRGGYDSYFDSVSSYFISNSAPINFQTFRDLYLDKNTKITPETINNLRICSKCIQIMISNDRIQDNNMIY